MYFSFYRSFPVQIQEYFQFYDKTILEYRSKSSNRILLHARTDSQEEYTTEELHEVFDGIYGKAFTIFYGETIQYYITEQTLQGRQAVESGMLAWEGNAQECGASRYGRLNGLLYAKQQNNDEKLQRLMLSYERQERMNEKLFHMLPY